MKSIFCFLICSLLMGNLLLAEDSSPVHSGDQKDLIGWTERIGIAKSEIVLYGRMEPARQSTMLYVPKITTAKSASGDELVNFELSDRFGNTHSFSQPSVRRTTLRTASGKARRVYVVALALCLAGKYIEEDVIVAERENVDHELHIGRQTLEGIFIVDPSQQFTADPTCPPRPASRSQGE